MYIAPETLADIQSGLTESIESGTRLLGEIATLPYSPDVYVQCKAEVVRFLEQLGRDPAQLPMRKSELARHFELTHQVCSTALNLFRLLALYLKPVLPALATQVEAFLNIEPLQWSDKDHLLKEHGILPFKPMLSRVTPEQIEALLESNKSSTPSTSQGAA